MMEIELVILFLASVLGAVTTSSLGWLDSGYAFDARKFVPGLIRGIIAAIMVFIPASQGYLGTTLGLPVILGALLAGMGVDVAVNRLAGILKIGQAATV